MELTHCPHCNERLIPYKVPEGCVCDPEEWRNPEKIPKICEAYMGHGGSNCTRCEHDAECHHA